MKKNEIFLATLIALLVLFFAHLPILLFSLFPKEGLVFLGRPVINSADVYTYVSFIEQAKQGKWLLINKFTSEPQIPSVIRPSYVLIGKFAKLTNISSIFAYHVAQIIFDALFFFLAYRLIYQIFKTPNQRLCAFFTLLTSSGLYWLSGSLIESTDCCVVEANTFLSLAGSPHFILSQAIMLLGILVYIKFVTEKKLVFGILTAVVLFPLAFEHPFDLIILTPILFLSGIWAGVPLIQGSVISCLLLAPLVFPWLELKQNAIFAAEQAQGALQSPPIIDWIFGFGLLLPLAGYGIKKNLSHSTPPIKVLIAWLFTVPFLLYLPVGFQRRFSEGWHIPITLLATVGLVRLYSYLKIETKSKSIAELIVSCLAIVLTFTAVYSTNRSLLMMGADSIDQYHYYISVAENRAINWIRTNIPEDAVILSDWHYGNIIAGKTIRHVYLGNETQTINFSQKVDKLNKFLVDTDNTSAYQFLKQNRIGYMFYATYNTFADVGFKPESKPYLEKVYDSEGVQIYKVKGS